jgi:hypothetical protein
MNVRNLVAVLLLVTSVDLVYAEPTQFDMFDNRIYVTGGANIGVLHNNWDQTAKIFAGDAGLGVEKLFPTSRIWLDFELSNLFSYHELDDNLTQSPKNPVPFDPKFFSMNLKLGRAFQIVSNDLQLTPYALVGKNGNLSPYTVLNTAVEQNQVKYINSGLNNYFWTTGIGGRLEYAVADTFDFYLDENLNYNIDNSKVQSPFVKQNNLELVNLIGAKWQAWRELQFAVEGYSNYQHYVLSQPEAQNSQFNPFMNFGTRFVVGLTF